MKKNFFSKNEEKFKNVKPSNISQVLCLHTQTPRRFPGFAAVVVKNVDEILNDFHDLFFGMCVFPEENQQPILGSHRFSMEK